MAVCIKRLNSLPKFVLINNRVTGHFSFGANNFFTGQQYKPLLFNRPIYLVKSYCKKVQSEAASPTKEVLTAHHETSLKKKTLEGGVVIKDITIGSGTTAKSGKTISVYYSGKLKSTNKVFDEQTDGPGLSFRLGRGDVIEGWDIGVVGMKVGGKRVITCPPAMAYGADGYPPVIPPNSTLIFEVQLKDVK